MKISASWMPILKDELDKPYFKELERFLAGERARHDVFPPEDCVFNALAWTQFDSVRVVILGQDPYHNVGQAHGLCFSVNAGVKLPGSLVNIFKELEADLGCGKPAHGCLEHWAKQGVLLLNVVLTVRAGAPHSHRGKGWEIFTDAILRRLNDRANPIVFVLWGQHAQAKAAQIDEARHAILRAPHPSPLSARTGFFGSRPFSTINETLKAWGKPPIDWVIPDP